MKYKVDGWNNFCQVFELPGKFPDGFCHGGGIPVNFQMVDWFYPVSDLPVPGVSKEVWKENVGEIKTKVITLQELQESLIPFLSKKNYVLLGRTYLVLCNFGASFTFNYNQVL